MHWLTKSEFKVAQSGDSIPGLAESDEENTHNTLTPSTITPFETAYSYATYNETSHSNYVGDPILITSAGAKGPATISHTVISTTTIGITFSTSLNSTEESAIKANASYTFQKLTSEQDTYNFPVPAGKIGWIKFVPYKHKSVGTVRYYYMGLLESTKNNVTTRSARNSGGHALGYYELSYSD